MPADEPDADDQRGADHEIDDREDDDRADTLEHDANGATQLTRRQAQHVPAEKIEAHRRQADDAKDEDGDEAAHRYPAAR